MFRAKYQGEVIEANNYNGDGHGLTCLYCNAVLDFVHSYTRGRKIVKPFFRLNRNSRHEESCMYNVDHLLKDAQTQLGTDIMNQKDGVYILHLQHSIDKHYGESKVSGSSGNLVDEIVQKKERNHKYIRTLFKILSIYIETEKNPELRQKLKLQYNGENIAWDDFFYEAKDLKRLYNAVPIEHPIVAYGRVTFRNRNEDKYAIIKCSEGHKTYVINGKLKFPEADTDDQLKDNSPYLLYFDKVSNGEPKNWHERVIYHDVYGDIKYQDHIYLCKMTV